MSVELKYWMWIETLKRTQRIVSRPRNDPKGQQKLKNALQHPVKSSLILTSISIPHFIHTICFYKSKQLFYISHIIIFILYNFFLFILIHIFFSFNILCYFYIKFNVLISCTLVRVLGMYIFAQIIKYTQRIITTESFRLLFGLIEAAIAANTFPLIPVCINGFINNTIDQPQQTICMSRNERREK